jgi:hypothetical protein
MFASPASYYGMITIVIIIIFFWLLLAALILKGMSLSLKMDLKQFFMWNHLVMLFMLLLMGSLQVIGNHKLIRTLYT